MLHRPPPVATFLLTLEAALYALLTFRPSSFQYIDYVDGYYLYVAQRVAQGATLYHQVQGVQPPLIFVVGALIFRLHDSLALIRLYSLLVHLAIQALVALAAYRLYRSQVAALVAGTLFALAPYSLQWDRIFDPNPLVTMLTLASVTALLFDGAQVTILAGMLGGLALVTKVWYVPVLIASVWYLGRAQPARLPRFLLGMALVAGVVCVLGWSLVGADFWKGLLAQDVSPLNLDWFRASITHVLDDETPLLVAALGGALLIARGRVKVPSLVLVYGLSSVVVLGATIKQGTAWPVFQFAEPALALLATALIVPVLEGKRRSRPRALPRATLPLIVLFVLVAIWSLPAIRAAVPASDASERLLTRVIISHSSSSATLLAPPIYLLLAGRRAFAEEADINLWDLADRSGDPKAMAAQRRLLIALSQRTIPVVLADQRVDRLRGVLPIVTSSYIRMSFDDPLPVDRSVEVWLAKPGPPGTHAGR